LWSFDSTPWIGGGVEGGGGGRGGGGVSAIPQH